MQTKENLDSEMLNHYNCNECQVFVNKHEITEKNLETITPATNVKYS